MGAAGFILEEKLMKDTERLDPILIVGCEGSSACVMWIIILAVFQFIPCQSDSFCTNHRLEDSYGAWLDYEANLVLLWQSLAIVILIPFSSICGVTTTKRGSASKRITILLARNFVVWVFFMTVPMSYSPQGTPVYSETFTWL